MYADAEALSQEACTLAFERISRAMQSRRRAVVVLSGGTTPRECYRLLAEKITEARIPANGFLWIFADERRVAVSHPDSNEGMARRLLLDRIGAPKHTILSWRADGGDPAACAQRYRDEILARMGTEGKPDLVILGMGADGHMASLFPEGRAVLPDGREMPVQTGIPSETAAVYRAAENEWRLTLCPVFLNRARTAAFLVTGAEKQAALRQTLKGNPSTPAAWIRVEETLYLVSRDAAAEDAPADFGGNIRFA